MGLNLINGGIFVSPNCCWFFVSHRIILVNLNDTYLMHYLTLRPTCLWYHPSGVAKSWQAMAIVFRTMLGNDAVTLWHQPMWKGQGTLKGHLRRERISWHMKYLLVEAYWVHLSGTRIMRAGRDAWGVASFHYESQAARNSRYVAQVLMAEFFKKCVENKVRFIARDGNAVSTYEAPHPPAGAPSKPSIIEAVAWQVFVNENEGKVVAHTFVHRPKEACVGILVGYTGDAPLAPNIVQGTGSIQPTDLHLKPQDTDWHHRPTKAKAHRNKTWAKRRLAAHIQ